jgi:hypothetical protein
VPPTNRAVDSLARAVAARERRDARLDLWLRQLLVDARAQDAGAVMGDVSTAEWIRDRVVRALGPVQLARADTFLGELRANAGDDDFEAAAATADELRSV